MPLDFTLAKYEELCRCMRDNVIATFTLRDWMQQLPEHGVALRHDVDRKPRNALNIASIEVGYGIHSSFYFRARPCSFVPEIIEEIHLMGHEIGYHYEDLSSAGGDMTRALSSFEENLGRLRELAPVSTISMHGSPLSAHDNRDLWTRHEVESFDVLGEAYQDIDYTDTYYFTDSGRSWSADSANRRDHVPGSLELPASVRSTDDLISFLGARRESKFVVTTHPERWADTYLELAGSLSFERLKLAAKSLFLRGRR